MTPQCCANSAISKTQVTILYGITAYMLAEPETGHVRHHHMYTEEKRVIR